MLFALFLFILLEANALTCRKGYFNQNGRCVACTIQNCLACTSERTCTECAAANTLYLGICMPCPANCAKCNSWFECQTCKNGFILGRNGQCHPPCKANCADCTADQCIECKVGYYLSNGDCNACNDGCASCLSWGCASCKPGFYFYYFKCFKCPENCASCTSSNWCDKCDAGYFVNSYGKCSFNCPANCYECTSSTYCTGCIAGYSRTYDGSCIKCPFPCRYCSKENTCALCMPLFYEVNGVCKSCPENCAFCDGNQCFGCIEGYSLNNGVCEQCPMNCKSCSSSVDNLYTVKYGIAWHPLSP